jgi:hypothetical protein
MPERSSDQLVDMGALEGEARSLLEVLLNAIRKVFGQNKVVDDEIKS